MERIEFGNELFAMVIRKGFEVEGTRFFTSGDNSFQLGILQHPRGYVEVPHIHKEQPKMVRDIQQMVYVEKGILAIDFFNNEGENVRGVELNPGDTILLISGAHSIRIVEDLRAITVKQGPYLGVAEDKIEMKGR